MNYPQTPGTKARLTSYEAAQGVKSKAATVRDDVLSLMRSSPYNAGGLTADQAADILNISILTVRPRFSELSAAGVIKDSGIRDKNRSGRNAVVWVAVIQGEQSSFNF